MINIFNRRYIGNKKRMLDKISEHVLQGESFFDVFAGTGTVSNFLDGKFKKIIVNDFLLHNFVIYNAFFSNKKYSHSKIVNIIDEINDLEYKENIFSKHYGDKWFTHEDASKIWEARAIIQKRFDNNEINLREFYILISVIIYAADKSSRSVGHFEAFLRSGKFKVLKFKMLSLREKKSEYEIYNEDSNYLVEKIKVDVAYIDPPYNSRQYAYFYHLLETIALFQLNEKTQVNGIAAKPEYIYNKSSLYSTSLAVREFENLIEKINAKKIIVSYNNTDKPSSSSSKNKISYEQIEEILSKKGDLTIEEIPFNFFNSGKTKFQNHKEFLFVVEVKND